MSLDHQVIVLYAATNGLLDDVHLIDFWFRISHDRFMDASHSEIGNNILSMRQIDTDTEAALKKAIQEFKLAGFF